MYDFTNYLANGAKADWPFSLRSGADRHRQRWLSTSSGLA